MSRFRHNNLGFVLISPRAPSFKNKYLLVVLFSLLETSYKHKYLPGVLISSRRNGFKHKINSFVLLQSSKRPQSFRMAILRSHSGVKTPSTLLFRGGKDFACLWIGAGYGVCR